MEKQITKILKTFDENGIHYSNWYAVDRLVEFDLGGADQLYQALQVLTDNLETWCYDWELGLEVKIEFDFERISITY